MRKILLLCFALLVSYNVSSRNKQFYKLILKYDIKQYLDSTTKSCAPCFWEKVWSNNIRFTKFMKAVKKETPAIKKAIQGLAEARKANACFSSRFEIISTHKDSLLMPLYNALGAADVTNYIKLLLVRGEDMNAFSTPDGEIYIYTGLLRDGIGFVEVLGACAHEMAHYLLQHAYVHAYTVAKRQNRNEIIGSIAAGVSIAAAGYAEANGVQQDWNTVNNNVNNIFISALVDTNKFGYKYSREQELEADIIAFRFLEAMGYDGGRYIHLLDVLAKNSPSLVTSDTDDHPSTSFRIELLRYMQNKGETDRKPSISH